MPLAGDTSKKFDKSENGSIFVGYSRGIATSRDAWASNYSRQTVVDTKEKFVTSYNNQLLQGSRDSLSRDVKWTTPVSRRFDKKIRIELSSKEPITYAYRPFVVRWFDNDERLNESSYQMPRIYPGDQDNLTICVPGIGVKKDFSCLITNKLTDLNMFTAGQCFPLYWYSTIEVTSDPKQRTLIGFETDEPTRHNGISDYALAEARKRYGESVTKEDIFYYIYGYLHSPDYRKAFSEDLKQVLPRIEFVDSHSDFLDFCNAGRALANLHLNYESAEPNRDVLINGKALVEEVLSNKSLLRVNKMRLLPEERRLVYNQYIEITNIPEKAFEYIVNGRSALGWLVDQYQVSTDKESGIVNDPNEYAGPEYIFNLVLSIITVSVKTMEIVESLPKLRYSDQTKAIELKRSRYRKKQTGINGQHEEFQI